MRSARRRRSSSSSGCSPRATSFLFIRCNLHTPVAFTPPWLASLARGRFSLLLSPLPGCLRERLTFQICRLLVASNRKRLQDVVTPSPRELRASPLTTPACARLRPLLARSYCLTAQAPPSSSASALGGPYERKARTSRGGSSRAAMKVLVADSAPKRMCVPSLPSIASY